jgi:SAM-dependent methyltransferase
MVHHISTRVTQFAYFSHVLEGPEWRGSKILDFGGNVGGFLVGAGDALDHDDYWCVDLSPMAIQQGRDQFPRAHFVHYNRYSSEFNPNGIRYLPVPDCGLEFDIILAFSVFTHIHKNEMLELVEQLKGYLAPRGALAFTFCEPGYDRSLSDPSLPSGSDVRKNLEWCQVKNKSDDIDAIVERARQSNWCVLIDEDLYVEPGKEFCHQERLGNAWESYCSYYTTEYMESVFPGAKFFPPVSPEWQHCCVIRKTEQ